MKEEGTNSLTVEIYRQKYKLKGKTDTAHLLRVSEYVDQKMKEVAAKNSSLDTAKIAVLTTVNMADEYLRLQDEYEKLLEILDEYTKE